MTHVEFWCKRCYIPKGHFTHQESITDAPMLRVCGKPPAPGRWGQPGRAASGRHTPERQRTAHSQRAAGGPEVSRHAQTPKSRRSDSQDCEENPSLFGFLLGTRDARGSICRAQTLGGPALSPSARAGVSTLSLEVHWAVAKDISVTAMFRIHFVVSWRSLGRSETVHAVVMLVPRRIWGRAPVRCVSTGLVAVRLAAMAN